MLFFLFYLGIKFPVPLPAKRSYSASLSFLGKCCSDPRVCMCFDWGLAHLICICVLKHCPITWFVDSNGQCVHVLVYSFWQWASTMSSTRPSQLSLTCELGQETCLNCWLSQLSEPFLIGDLHVAYMNLCGRIHWFWFIAQVFQLMWTSLIYQNKERNLNYFKVI